MAFPVRITPRSGTPTTLATATGYAAVAAPVAGWAEGELATTEIAYQYDELSRLTEANYSDGTYFHYGYDANGNRLSETTAAGEVASVYDVANRLTSVGGISYTWDNNGNLTEDGTRTYAYDTANRLVSVSADGAEVSSYAYNGLGDRLVDGETQFVMDLNSGLTQALQAGEYSYLYGNGRIGQFAGAESAFFLGDALGSVRQLVNAGGEVTLVQSYAPYGEVLESTGDGETRYAFTGEWNSSYIKLIYLRSRLYSPVTGRFITRDSWQGDYNMPMSYNAWLYGYGNPVSYSDPQGRSPIKRTYATYSSQFNNWKVEDTDNVWTEGEIERIETDLSAVARAFARTYNAELSRRKKCGDYTYLSRRGISATAAFYYIYDGPITIIRSPENVPDGAWGNFNGTTGADLTDGFDVIKIWRSTTVQEITDSIGYMVHEVGHAFEAEVSTKLHQSVKAPIGESLYWRTYPGEIHGGFAGGHGTWQWSPGAGGYNVHDPNDLKDDTDGRGEIFADMFVGWAYNQWETSLVDPSVWSTKGWERANFMNSNMSQWVFNLIDQKLPTWY